MKSLCAFALLCLAAVYSCEAQSASRVEVALGYAFTHSNAPPGGCGCFHFNGGSGSVIWKLNPAWGFVAEFGGAHAGAIPKSALDPTMVTYLFGPRYSFTNISDRFTPFGNVLVGASHVAGGYFPSSTTSSGSANAFAMAAGGGVDFTLSKHIALRLAEADYLLTLFPNAANDRQNNFRFTSGVVFKLGGH
jgi:peptidoglycan-associated lipoprotein